MVAAAAVALAGFGRLAGNPVGERATVPDAALTTGATHAVAVVAERVSPSGSTWLAAAVGIDAALLVAVGLRAWSVVPSRDGRRRVPGRSLRCGWRGPPIAAVA